MFLVRHQDHVLIGADLNLEFGGACDGYVPSTVARTLLHQFGLSHTWPGSRTWWNHTQERKIDYILYSGPKIWASSEGVIETPAHCLGADHAVLHAAVCTTKITRIARRRRFLKCGEWVVKISEALEACSEFAKGQECMCMHDIEMIGSRCSHRPKSLRYVDPPEIKELIQQRKRTTGEEASSLDLECLLSVPPGPACITLFRRLAFEAQALALQNLQSRLERTSDAEPKVLPLQEKMARTQRQQGWLASFSHHITALPIL